MSNRTDKSDPFMGGANFDVVKITLKKGDRPGAWTYDGGHITATITPYVPATTYRNIRTATKEDGTTFRCGTISHKPEELRVVSVYYCGELFEEVTVKDLHDARKVLAWWSLIPPR